MYACATHKGISVHKTLKVSINYKKEFYILDDTLRSYTDVFIYKHDSITVKKDTINKLIMISENEFKELAALIADKVKAPFVLVTAINGNNLHELLTSEHKANVMTMCPGIDYAITLLDHAADHLNEVKEQNPDKDKFSPN